MSTQGKPRQAPARPALAAALAALLALLAGGVTEPARAQDATVAGALAGNLYIGRTFARAAEVDAQLQALTLEQVNAALRRHLKPENFVYGFAGDFKKP